MRLGRKRVLLSLSAGGIYPNLGVAGYDKGQDCPIYVVNQIQSLIRADIQPEYTTGLHESGIFWQGALLKAQEIVASRLGIQRVALNCRFEDDGARRSRIRGAYAQTAKALGYTRVKAELGFGLKGLTWVKDLSALQPQ